MQDEDSEMKDAESEDSSQELRMQGFQVEIVPATDENKKVANVCDANFTSGTKDTNSTEEEEKKS